MPLEELLRRGTAVPIRRWDEPVLHRPCRAVTDFGPDLWNLLCTLFATNRAADGAGLAAPQIGIDLAVFVYDCTDGFGLRRRGLVCNPRIVVPPAHGEHVELEGCLSLPGAHEALARPDTAVCRGVDQFGEPVSVRGTGVLARCLQHETDHVQGVVFEDRLTPAARRRLRSQHRLMGTEFGPSWPAS